MRKWSGIETDQAAVGDAPVYVENGRYYIEGELQRRRGLEKFAAYSGEPAVQFNPSAGFYVVFVRSNGEIETVAAT